MEKPSNPVGKADIRLGRPSLPDHKKKKSRNITVSDKAWESLDQILKDLGLRSISDLIEKIGLEQISVLPLNENSDSKLTSIPIYQKLKLFIQQPVAVFWSLLTFVKRTAHQLHLQDDEADFCAVVLQAMAVVFYVGYTNPDSYINNPSAFLRWLCYRILLVRAESQLEAETVKEPNQLETSQDCLVRIHNAIENLNTASHAPHYRVLKMKSIDGLTIGQIIKIFELQSYSKDESQVGRMIKKGLSQFRELWNPLDSARSSNEIREQVSKSYPEASLYCAIATSSALDDHETRIQLECLLLETRNNSELDFWINEIDYYYGSRLSNDPAAYAAEQEKLRQTIDREIDEYILEKQKTIDPKIASCGSKHEIEEVLREAIKEEVGKELPLRIVLDPNFSQILDIIESLEAILKQTGDVDHTLGQYIENLKRNYLQ